ncbi:hypothetical protein CONLIGDRAFT_687827 [Coniochaeta ligniaria NRRL 30616]|uniref:Uncharacterized protein n=1 Tax=Coniochaeta ligniaria NRRL 30616 TaxID=1408157 RepID=A0A1J7IX33_9PEZI|nr:hypothetical protein CONLIGDRAFT_687827 [Coniochaeta ligniaria NRRL 30616]
MTAFRVFSRDALTVARIQMQEIWMLSASCRSMQKLQKAAEMEGKVGEGHGSAQQEAKRNGPATRDASDFWNRSEEDHDSTHTHTSVSLQTTGTARGADGPAGSDGDEEDGGQEIGELDDGEEEDDAKGVQEIDEFDDGGEGDDVEETRRRR